MGGRGEVVFCYCSDGGVPEDAPSESRGGREKKGEEEGGDSVHFRILERSLDDN